MGLLAPPVVPPDGPPVGPVATDATVATAVATALAPGKPCKTTGDNKIPPRNITIIKRPHNGSVQDHNELISN